MADINKNKLVNAGALQTVAQNVLTKGKDYTDEKIGSYGTVSDGNLSGQSGVRGEIQEKELALQADIKALQDTVGGTGGTSLKDRLNAVETAIGNKATDTATSDTIYGLIKAEAKARADKDTEIDGLLGTKDDAAAANGTAFAQIKQEVATRTSEIARIDGLLGTKDDATTKDTAFGRIAKEVADRAAADKAINDALGKAADTAAADGTVFARIKQEISDRAAGDTALRTDLGNKTDSSSTETAFGRIAKAQESANNVKASIGTPADTKDMATVYGAIAKEADTRSAADTAINGLVGNKNDASTVDTAFGRIRANTEAIGVLNGSSTTPGSVAKQVADGIASVVANAPENFDTLKEIADYIATDKTNATAMLNKINANEEAIGILKGADTVEGSVAKAVKDAKDELNTTIGNYSSTTGDGQKVPASGVRGDIESLRGDVVSTFNDLDLAFGEKDGKPAVQIVLTQGQDGMGGSVTTPLSALVAIPVVSDADVSSIIDSLQ